MTEGSPKGNFVVSLYSPANAKRLPKSLQGPSKWPEMGETCGSSIPVSVTFYWAL